MKHFIIDATYQHDRRGRRTKGEIRRDPREHYRVIEVTPDGDTTGYSLVTPFPMDGRSIVGVLHRNPEEMATWEKTHEELLASLREVNGGPGKIWDIRA